MPGFSRAQLIEIANRRTERRGEKPLDLESEFLFALTQVCKETRWHWRKKNLTFSTAVGTAEYDLTTLDAYKNLIPEKFVKDGVRLIEPTGPTVLWPMFDHDEQANALEATAAGKPSAYFLEPGTLATLRLDLPADQVYKIRTVFWALPYYAKDAVPDEVPLVPPHLQDLVALRLEMQIFRYTLGEGSAKYQAAAQEYKYWLAQAHLGMDFADGQIEEYGRLTEGEAIQGGQN